MTPPPSQRLVSLDLFRGATIAGMFVVNTPGSWDHVYPQLLHAEWNGWTYTDTIFPFFLFIVGVSMAFSFSAASRREAAARVLAASYAAARRNHLRARPRPEHPLLLPVSPRAGAHPGRAPADRRLLLPRRAHLPLLRPEGTAPGGGCSPRRVLGADDVRSGAGLRHGATRRRREPRGLRGPRCPRRSHLEAQPRLGPGGPALEPLRHRDDPVRDCRRRVAPPARAVGTQARRPHGRGGDRVSRSGSSGASPSRSTRTSGRPRTPSSCRAWRRCASRSVSGSWT